MLKTLEEALNESLAKSVKIVKNNNPLNPEQMKSYVTQYKMVSQKFADKYENIIGVITFDNSGRHIEYALFELDSEDKKEFGSDGVYGISSNNMVHQGRSIVKLKGRNIYFLDSDAYADEEKVVFNDSARIKTIGIVNKKYFDKF